MSQRNRKDLRSEDVQRGTWENDTNKNHLICDFVVLETAQVTMKNHYHILLKMDINVIVL